MIQDFKTFCTSKQQVNLRPFLHTCHLYVICSFNGVIVYCFICKLLYIGYIGFRFKAESVTFGIQASCSMRLLGKQFCWTLPSLFLLLLALYFICCHTFFKVQFAPKIHEGTKRLQGKLQQSKLVRLSSTQAG